MSKVKVKSHGPEIETKDLFLDKLAESGLTEDDAEELGMTYVESDETASYGKNFIRCPALKIPYFDMAGLPASDVHGCDDYFRVRYLGNYEKIYEMSNGGLPGSKKKPPKYMQKSNTLPMVYYPRISDIDWLSICEDISQPLIITEGELKAAKATKEGFPTIGLGGVSSWRSMKHGIEFLPSLQLIKWTKRYVYIVFDSDYKTNPQVCAELHKLAEHLDFIGAYVYIVTLTQTDEGKGGKVGLDDYLVAYDNRSFVQLLKTAEPLGLAKSLFNMNDKYAYVSNPGVVIELKTGRKISPEAFKSHVASDIRYMSGTLMKDGTVRYQSVKAAPVWLDWVLRNKADSMVYMPGEPKMIDGIYNTWIGWGIEPEEGDITPFTELLDHLFTDTEEGARKWFEQWLAYPLQNPGVKMFSSSVIHGVYHGTGKSLLGYTLGEIYGVNFTEISQNDLHASFNDWAEGKQFIMGDDVTGSDKRADADFLKKLITQKELRVNQKYLPAYTVKDCINYFFTANHPDAFFLEDNDRRFFIHEVVVGPLGNDFYQRYDAWLKSGGAKYVFHYLLNLDTSDFKPFAPAYMTAAKERMIESVRSDLGTWVRQLKLNSDFVLSKSIFKYDKDMLTTQQILSMYDPEKVGRVTANGMGRELSKAGFRQAHGGKLIKLNDGSLARYYIIRNFDKWIHASLENIKAHLDGKEPVKKSSKKY